MKTFIKTLHTLFNNLLVSPTAGSKYLILKLTSTRVKVFTEKASPPTQITEWGVRDYPGVRWYMTRNGSITVSYGCKTIFSDVQTWIAIYRNGTLVSSMLATNPAYYATQKVDLDVNAGDHFAIMCFSNYYESFQALDNIEILSGTPAYGAAI